jgi:ubiquitin C-terminal hydrolase
MGVFRKCKSLVVATKQLTIYDEPNVLVVHLKRFDAASYVGGGGSKITRHISFPMTLNLEPYCSQDRTGMSLKGGVKGTPPEYHLCGVVVHQVGWDTAKAGSVCHTSDACHLTHHVMHTAKWGAATAVPLV